MISIITPTYNRAYILPRLYESLCNQTCMDFEWVVIDDGSIDNTEALISGWVNSEPIFNIIYRKRDSTGGPHRAMNDALKIIRSTWFMGANSPFKLRADAVELIHKWIATVERDERFVGVYGLLADMSTKKIYNSFPYGKKNLEYIDISNLQRRKHGLLGDNIGAYRTEVFKRYPYPEFEGENFFIERVVLDRMSFDGYKSRWFNKVLAEFEYLDDGLTKMKDAKYLNSFKGFTYATREEIKMLDFFERNVAILHYMKIAKKKGLSQPEAKNRISISNTQLYMAMIDRLCKKTGKRIRRLYSKVKSLLSAH